MAMFWSRSFILPFMLSYLFKLSINAFASLLACCGVKIILDFTRALGTPGSNFMKSIINSLFECVIIAKLEYIPSAISSLN